MAPKIGSKESTAEEIKGAVTKPKCTCKAADNVKGASTSPKYTEEGPIKGSVQRKR